MWTVKYKMLLLMFVHTIVFMNMRSVSKQLVTQNKLLLDNELYLTLDTDPARRVFKKQDESGGDSVGDTDIVGGSIQAWHCSTALSWRLQPLVVESHWVRWYQHAALTIFSSTLSESSWCVTSGAGDMGHCQLIQYLPLNHHFNTLQAILI